MNDNIQVSVSHLVKLIHQGDRELLLHHLERMFLDFKEESLLFIVGAAIDMGWIEEAWLLVSAVVIVEPAKSSVLASWVAHHLRNRGWGFLADAVEQAGEQSFLNHFGISRSELNCGWGEVTQREDKTP